MNQEVTEEIRTRWALKEKLRNHRYILEDQFIAAAGLVGSRDRIPGFMEVYGRVMGKMPTEWKRIYRDLRLSGFEEVLMAYAMDLEKAEAQGAKA